MISGHTHHSLHDKDDNKQQIRSFYCLLSFTSNLLLTSNSVKSCQIKHRFDISNCLNTYLNEPNLVLISCEIVYPAWKNSRRGSLLESGTVLC